MLDIRDEIKVDDSGEFHELTIDYYPLNQIYDKKRYTVLFNKVSGKNLENGNYNLYYNAVAQARVNIEKGVIYNRDFMFKLDNKQVKKLKGILKIRRIEKFNDIDEKKGELNMVTLVKKVNELVSEINYIKRKLIDPI